MISHCTLHDVIDSTGQSLATYRILHLGSETLTDAVDGVV
ncbi:hypothetical protein AHF37_04137 [Paragonimus kellicotti]|nr:hypothetical protein AHF37_04137 [Paragonimus kellicotti]